MKAFFEYIKNHKILIGIGFLVVIFIGPLLLNCLFKFSSPLDFLIAEWSAGDALGYYGNVLSFTSTTFLSILALWQNHIIEKTSKEHTKLLERMEREKNLPFFIIENTLAYGNGINIKFNLKNISDNIAQNITVSNIKIKNHDYNEIWSNDKKIQIHYLGYNDKSEISLENPAIEDISHIITLTITYFDKFGEVHSYNVVGNFKRRITIPDFKFINNT